MAAINNSNTKTTSNIRTAATTATIPIKVTSTALNNTKTKFNRFSVKNSEILDTFNQMQEFEHQQFFILFKLICKWDKGLFTIVCNTFNVIFRNKKDVGITH
jgi:hypothetical protein